MHVPCIGSGKEAGMTDDRIGRLDTTLATLDTSIRAGDHRMALDLYLAFDGELTRYVRGEERLLFPVLERFTSMPYSATVAMRNEHRSLRRLVDSLGVMIAQHDKAHGLDILASLRSVLMFHIAKEEWVLDPLVRPASL
jgi:iron-sulfur cluster repair protein YtfE (RIC family)